MELAKGKIGDVNVLLGCSTVAGYDHNNKLYANTDYYLLAQDTGSGTISMQEYKLRTFDIKDQLLDKVLEAQRTKQDLIKSISSSPKITHWINSVKPILLHNDGLGKIMVELKYSDTPKPEPRSGLVLPQGLNTLTLPQLEEAFKKTVKDNEGVIYDGIQGGYIKLEDSLPWFEVQFKGKASAKKAKDFCQQLADQMNIRILFNRVEGGSTSYSVLGVMDIDNIKKGKIVGALSSDGESAEFMQGYGEPILPSHTKKTKKLKR